MNINEPFSIANRQIYIFFRKMKAHTMVDAWGELTYFLGFSNTYPIPSVWIFVSHDRITMNYS
jgi:hypothetical protein